MPSAHVSTGFVEISSSRSPPLVCFSLTLWSIKTRLQSNCFSLYANVSNPSVSKFRLALVQSGLAWAGSLGFKRWDLARPSCQLPIKSAGDWSFFYGSASSRPPCSCDKPGKQLPRAAVRSSRRKQARKQEVLLLLNRFVYAEAAVLSESGGWVIFFPNVAVRLVVDSFGLTVQMQTVKRNS